MMYLRLFSSSPLESNPLGSFSECPSFNLPVLRSKASWVSLSLTTAHHFAVPYRQFCHVHSVIGLGSMVNTPLPLPEVDTSPPHDAFLGSISAYATIDVRHPSRPS